MRSDTENVPIPGKCGGYLAGICASAADARTVSVSSPIDRPALLAAIYDGVAAQHLGRCLGWLSTRAPANLGHALPSTACAGKTGQIEGWLLTDRCLLQQAAGLELTATGNTNLAKVTITDNAVAGRDFLALELTPAIMALSRQHPRERHYRNVLCGRDACRRERQRVTAGGRSAHFSIAG